MPDIETAFFQEYRDQGLEVIAIDPDSLDITLIGTLTEYVSYLDVTFPVGVETESVYSEIEGVHDGGNPYPVDIIVDAQGIIQYVAREYDPTTMDAVVQSLLTP